MSINYTQTHLKSYQEIEFLDYSNHSYINALLNSSKAKPFKWKGDKKYSETNSLNNSTVITYSFPGSNGENSKYSYTDELGVEIILTPLNQTQIDDIKLALDHVSNFLNVTFTEVQDNSIEVGTIRIGVKTITDSAGNYKASTSGTSNAPSNQTSGGDIFFNDWLINANFSSGLIKDSQSSIGDISILYHELFHALGIEHPNDNPSIPFDESKNSKEFTLMASDYSTNQINEYMLNQSTKYTVTSTPMVYDIAALQYLYGANNLYNIDNNIYSYDPNKPFIETLWDAGGIDTLDLSNFNKENHINLNEGNYSTISFDVNWSMSNNFAIAYDTIIENVKGGSNKDHITGNIHSNRIQGNGGDDIIDGGEGDDTVVYTGSFKEYIFKKTTTTLRISDLRSTNNDGVDTIQNIENIEFSNIGASIEDLCGETQLKMIKGQQEKLTLIRDYDANLHGFLDNIPNNVLNGYKYQGKLDVNNDGVTEAVYTNQVSGRWVTASIDSITGLIDYSKHGAGETTRIVGIYQDPLVSAGLVEKDGPFDGSRTFTNDIKLDNLILKTVGDYDGDGFQEVYWSKVDNTAYLRAVMHADGNIQYANYQNLTQMTDYLTSHGFADTVALIA